MKKTAYLRFGHVRQETGEKFLQPGELISSTNAVQSARDGLWEKRRGWNQTTMTFSGGTLSGSPTSLLPGATSNLTPSVVYNSLLMRDTGDQLWAQSSSSWVYRGQHKRSYCAYRTIDSTAYAEPKPVCCAVNTEMWTFSLHSNGYKLSVLNRSTGAVLVAPFSITATGIHHAAACYCSGFVYLFWVDNSNLVYYHQFVAATPTVAPTAVTYHTVAANAGNAAKLQQVDCTYMLLTRQVFVSYCGGNTSIRQYAGHSLMTEAGAEIRSGTSADNVAAGLTNVMNGLCNSAGQEYNTSSYFYYSYFGFQPGRASGDIGTVMVKVTLSDASSTLGLGVAQTGADDIACSSISLCTPEDKQIVLASWSNFGNDCGFVKRTHFSSGSYDSPATAIYETYWIASKFIAIGTTWYFLTGFDDVMTSARYTGTALLSEEMSTQRTYHVRCLDASSGSVKGTIKLVGHVMNGLASAAFHRYVSTAPGATDGMSCPMLVTQSDTKFETVVGSNDSAVGGAGIALVEVETAKIFGKDCQAMHGRAFSPGSIPVVWSASESLHEIAPLLSPTYATEASAGVGSDFVGIAFVYVIKDSDGTTWRSTPLVVSQTIGHGATWVCNTLRHHLSGTTISIEVYLGTTSTLKLQTVLAQPDPTIGTAHYVSYTTPTAAAMANGEILYTSGNGLSQDPPPQCQCIGAWRNRLFLGQGNAIWYSQEFESGKGTLFNYVLKSVWGGYDREISAISANDNTCASIIGPDGVAAITGPGPDGLGNGAYTVQTITTNKGMVAGGICIQGQQGVYFNDVASRRLVCALPTLQVVECAGGLYDYTTKTITGAMMYEAKRLILFCTSNGYILTIDYQHPRDSAQFGITSLWTFGSIVGRAATTDSTGPVMVDSNGYLWRPGVTYRDATSTDYRMSLRLACLQPEGIQGEFSVSRVQMMGTYVAAFSAVMSTYPNDSATGTTTGEKSFSSGPTWQMATRPPNCLRIRSLGVAFTETAGTSGACTLEGVAMEYTPKGRLNALDTTDVIA